MDSWWKRIRIELDRKKWSVVEFERRTGIDRGRLYKYVTGEVEQPRGDAFTRMAKALDVSEWWLRTGEGTRSVRLAVIGQISAGEQWVPLPVGAEGERLIDFDLGSDESIVLEVLGTSMAPAYRNGDLVVCSRKYHNHIDQVDPSQFSRIDCAVMTTDGRGFLKFVVAGRTPGIFTLRSYNPDFQDIEDVELQWIAPVVWIRRSR
ncbi:MAG: helix-turn-helix domain-containing protein [Azospirillum sp.]|nr:helix-turn-helix domain-containing protein [Azospirillum sp.]